jgi:hypothetical protein
MINHVGLQRLYPAFHAQLIVHRINTFRKALASDALIKIKPAIILRLQSQRTDADGVDIILKSIGDKGGVISRAQYRRVRFQRLPGLKFVTVLIAAIITPLLYLVIRRGKFDS